MPNTYKSYPTILGTTAATTIYPGISGSAIVNSVVFSNTNISLSTTATLELVRGLTAYSLITRGSLPNATSLQALDSPIILQDSDILRGTIGNTGSIHVIVSVLEMT